MIGQRIGKGKTAEVFEWLQEEAGSTERVIKLFFPSMEHMRDGEWEISQWIEGQGLPVPRTYGREEVSGRSGIIYERINGPTLTEAVASRLWNPGAAGSLLASLHELVHRVTAAAEESASSQASTALSLPRQKEMLERYIRHTPLLEAAWRQRVLERLASLPAGDRLCHGDLHSDNVIISLRGPIILDWMTSVSGHPACDAARTWMVLQDASLPPGIPAELVPWIEQFREDMAAAYKEAYTRGTGVTEEEIRDWLPVVAAARLVENVDQEEQSRLLERVRAGLA
ncbi:aminoglycoside phosphotransferase family protein [Paenibacillus filicis]|uniref:Aminoglycoside phosphotransferase family protein n=1 Tax=Paenibacillus filicis TaxID=669464 RepID=A0ABU9DVH6_9BACL